MKAQILLIAAALSCLSFAEAVARQENVLLKEDFEEGANQPKAWRKGARIQGVKYKYDKKQGTSGERSLCIEKTAQRYFPIAQWSRKVKHKSDASGLSVSVQVKAKDMTKAIVDVLFYDKRGELLGHEWVSYIGSKKDGDPPANHDWKEYRASAEIPDETDRMELALQVYGPGTVWFDDLNVAYVSGDAETTGDEAEAPDNMVEVAVGESKGSYLYIAPGEKPDPGNALLIVLPGGDGSADFHPFVSNIHANSLWDDFALAQPIAKKWTRNQSIVWPTAFDEVKKKQYNTEELIEAVVADVGKKTKLDPKRIYVLAWSSGGPAAYAALCQKETSLAGGMLAMSVFKPDQLPELENAKDRRFYIYHSAGDKVCPFWMAEEAKEMFTDLGIRNKLVKYRGGHGWHGNIFGSIEKGMLWLEDNEE
jgi:predicted esterase